MSSFVLDTGALVAVQRDRRRLRALLRAARELGLPLRTSAPVLTEFIGGSPRTLRPAADYVSSLVEVAIVDEARARRAAALRQKAVDSAPKSDPSAIDALVAGEAEAVRGFLVIAGDRGDFEPLAAASGLIELVDLGDIR